VEPVTGADLQRRLAAGFVGPRPGAVQGRHRASPIIDLTDVS
jgi:hypothetical protein